jgi:hypothetical protein
MFLIAPPFWKSGIDYDTAIAAITNKTLYCRADTAIGANNTTLTTTNWDNEAVATPNVEGTATYQTTILGGHRGILANAAGEFCYPGSSLSTILGGSGLSYTMFAVEKRSGTQGTSTGNARYQNSAVMSDSGGYLGMYFNGSSRQFVLMSFTGNPYNEFDTGFSFTDNVPYVLAWRVAADGSARVNYNGSIATAAAGNQVNPSNINQQFRMNRWATSGGTNYGFEYIVSSDEMSDAVMDNAVTALKAKWGVS